MRGDRQNLSYDDRKEQGRIMANFSMLGGGMAWLLHLLLAWIFSEFGCISGLGDRNWAGLSMVAWSIILITVITSGIAFFATFTSAKAGERLKWATGDAAPIAEENQGFIARFSFIMNAIFLFIILMQAIPIIFHLRAC